MNAPNSPHRTPLSIIWSTCSTWLRGGPGRLLVAAILISALVSAAVTVGIQGLALRSNGTSIPLLGTRVSVSDDSAVASVTQKSAPAVVSILIQGSTAPAPSGFLVSSDGYIVTSAGAVVNAPRIQVELAGDTRLYDARVVDHDCQTGLVVLKVDQVSHPSSLTFGDSSVVQPGQTGILLGGAPTERSVVHRTVVSGVGRINSLANLFPESGDVQMSGLIEVDAPSDPLLNGAPLLSVDGQVVGLSIQTDIAGKQIDFVEPAGALQTEVQQAIAGGQFVVATDGLDSLQVSPDQAAATGRTAGARITAINSDGPASAAGLKVDDVITKLNDTSVDLTHPLPQLMRSNFHPGQRVSVTYQRAGETAQAELTLGGEHPECRSVKS